MREEYEATVPFAFLWGVIFYIVPIIIGETAIFSYFSWFIIPVLCFLSGLVITMKEDFYWYYPIIVGIIFFVALLFHSSYFLFWLGFIYIACCYVGCVIAIVIEVLEQ